MRLKFHGTRLHDHRKGRQFSNERKLIGVLQQVESGLTGKRTVDAARCRHVPQARDPRMRILRVVDIEVHDSHLLNLEQSSLLRQPERTDQRPLTLSCTAL